MSDLPLAIGIDFGGTSVKTGVLYRGNLIEEAPRIETQNFESAAPLIECIHETIKDFDIDVDLALCSHCFYDSKKNPPIIMQKANSKENN